MTDRLNPEALEAACAGFYNDPMGLTNWHRLCAADPALADKYRAGMNAAVSAYLAALPAPRTITGEQVNRAGWTCYGIHEPGNYATCEECRDACDDLANFYNNMHRNPVSGKTWTGQPTEGGGK